MNRIMVAMVCVFCLNHWGCRKIVEIEDHVPELVHHCVLDPKLEGRWTSDSVRITTDVDTLDSQLVNHGPTMLYFATFNCGDEPLFKLEYLNFAGVETRDINSTNYTATDGKVYVYNDFDLEADIATAGFRMRYEMLPGDSLAVFEFEEQANPHQRSHYRLKMRKN